MKYKLAVFDMDGTILNTLDDLRDSCNYALAQCGFPARTTDEIRQFVGNGVQRLIALACPPDATEADHARVLEIYRPYYRAHANDQAHPYDGIPELLAALKERGVKLAVVSNKPHEAVCDLCDVFFPGMFDVIIGEQAGLKRKPAPDMVFAACDTVNRRMSASSAASAKVSFSAGAITLNDIVYIGDSEVDVETARAAGTDLIAVSWGFRSVSELKDAGASVIVHTAGEILESVTSAFPKHK